MIRQQLRAWGSVVEGEGDAGKFLHGCQQAGCRHSLIFQLPVGIQCGAASTPLILNESVNQHFKSPGGEFWHGILNKGSELGMPGLKRSFAAA